jgi:MFS family permease
VTRMLVLFVLAHWGHHLLSSVVPPLLPSIRGTFNISHAQAGGLFSAFTIAYGASQLPSGWLADRIGRRFLLLLGISGVAFWGVLAGLAPNYGVMLVFMVLLGLFGGGYHPASAPAVSGLVEPRRRGWALGIHQIGGTASNLSAPLIAAGLAASYLGWRSAFIIPGIIVVVLGIVLFILMGNIKRPGSVAAGTTARAADAAPLASRERLVLYIIIGTAGQIFILAVAAFVSMFVVDELGKSVAIGALMLAVVYVGGMPSGPLAGYLSDRIGAGRVLLIASLIAGPAIFLLNGVASVWMAVPVLLVIGAMMFTVMPVSEAYIISQTPESRRSTVLGVYYAVSRGGSSFLILGLGYLIDSFGFHVSFAVAGVVLFAIVGGCGLLLWARRGRVAPGAAAPSGGVLT